MSIPIVKITIAGITMKKVALPVTSGEYVQEWINESIPPPEWYKTFSAASYHLHAVDVGVILLAPVKGRPCYTFDDYGDFVETMRDFNMRLFDQGHISDVQQYRIRMGPPCTHKLYRLPPTWTYK